MKTFKYNVVVGNHFDYRDAVDNYNAKWNDYGTKLGLSLEETWKTTKWACRVFAFILAISEVNASVKCFASYEGSQLEFRKTLAYELIDNPYDKEYVNRRSSSRQILRVDNHH